MSIEKNDFSWQKMDLTDECTMSLKWQYLVH